MQFPEALIAIIGYACGVGSVLQGSENGPQVLRNYGLGNHLKELNCSFVDFGDAKPTQDSSERTIIENKMSANEKLALDFVDVFSACATLHTKTEDALSKGMFPIVLGGDHSLSIGSISAVANYYAKKGKKIGVIWIDAHADVNSIESSPSKRIFGMSLGVLLGRVPGLLSSFQNPSPAISSKNVAYIGLRDIDPDEKRHIREHGIGAYTMKEIDMFGVGRVVEQAISRASDGTAGFVVSLDLDVCDPKLVPGVGTPYRGGLTFRETHLITELLYDSEKMLSFELVEFNPRLDQENRTADMCLSIIESAVGKSIL